MKKFLNVAGVVNRDAPITLNLDAKRGDTFDADIFLTDSGSSSIFDFSQYDSALLQVRKNRPDLPILIFDSAASPTEIILSADRVTLTKAATEMASKLGGVYRYDLQLSKISGEVFTILSGQFTIKDDITY